MKNKRCPKCKETKELSSFHKDESRKGKLRHQCKACINERMLRYSHSRHGKAVNVAYRQSEVGRRAVARGAAKQRKLHPLKIKARKAVSRAVAVGKLPSAKTSECVYCGNHADNWHHWAGYEPEHWFDIIPLCWKCDKKAHQEGRFLCFAS